MTQFFDAAEAPVTDDVRLWNAECARPAPNVTLNHACI
jgi:hypothetical protein